MNLPATKLFFSSKDQNPGVQEKYVSGYTSEDSCVVCIFTPFLTFGSSIGFLQIEGRCPHKQKEPCQPRYQKVQLAFLFPSIMGLVLVASIIYRISNLDAPISPAQAIRLTSETLYTSCSLMMVSMSYFLADRKIFAMNAWVQLVQSFENFGRSNILSDKTKKLVKSLKRVFLFAIFTYIAFVIMYSSWLVAFEPQRGLVIKEVLLMVCILLQIPIIFQFNAFSMFVTGILENQGMCLRYFITRKLSITQNAIRKPFGGLLYLGPKKWSTNFSLLQVLTIIRKQYAGTISNFNYMNRHLGVLLVIWFGHISAILIFNLVILYETYLNYTDINMYDVILEIRTDTLILNIVIMLHKLEKVARVGNDMQSFLFRYPISKLNTAEAAQVEMLITALNIQKPVITASGIFNVGTGLISSLTGTVITYVLVALQFKAAWD